MKQSVALFIRTSGLIFALCGGGGHQAWGQSEQSLRMDFGQAWYATEIPRSDIDQQYSQISLRHRWDWKIDDRQNFVSDALGLLPMSDGADNGLAVRDLHWRVHTENRRLGLTVGRDRRVWSALDDDFGLGIWQPLARWDLVNPVSLGLTGVFMDMRGEMGGITLFLTGVHLPDQMADYEIVDGRITSRNRWFRAPVSRLEFERGSSIIHYQVLEPEVRDVVWQSAYALKGEWGRRKGLFSRVSYADKPANQFHLGIDTESAVQVENQNTVYPKIIPINARHRVLSAEAGWRSDDFSAYVSWTRENYEDPRVNPNWDQTPLMDGRYWGAAVSGRVFSKVLPPSRFRLGYVTRVIDDAQTASTHIEGNTQASTSRLNFDELWTGSLETRWYEKGSSRLSSRLRYAHSPVDNGEWLSFDIAYSPEEKWTWRLGADIFGVDDGAPASSSFISDYRANDRVSGGVTYVF